MRLLPSPNAVALPLRGEDALRTMTHEGYHEPYDKLSEEMRTMHRAILSAIEELEAIDWYYQRAEVTPDESLKAILLHNAHEEIEHATMVLEWIRRRDGVFDANMRRYLFRDGDIVATESSVRGTPAAAGESTPVSPRAGASAPPTRRSLGSLRSGT